MISWEEFKTQGVLLAKDLKKYDKEGAWSWESVRILPELGNGMLRRTPQILSTVICEENTENEDIEVFYADDDDGTVTNPKNVSDDEGRGYGETFYVDKDEATDTAALGTHPTDSSTITQKVFVEYSIVWSTIYQVPVLHFNLWEEVSNERGDGTYKSSLTKGIEKIISGFEKQAGIKDSGEVMRVNALLSQGEHPLLGVSSWYLHPCKTASVMEAILPKEEEECHQYLKAWLALYGSFVGLNVDFL